MGRAVGPAVLGHAIDRLLVVVLHTSAPPPCCARPAACPRCAWCRRSPPATTASPTDAPGRPAGQRRRVHDATTADLAVGLAIASLRGIDTAVHDQARGRWPPSDHLAGRPAACSSSARAGWARAVARQAGPVRGRRSPRVASSARWTTCRAVRPVHGDDELPALLPRHDVVVLACPLTEATRGLMGARLLAAMPDGALLVNVARGPSSTPPRCSPSSGRAGCGPPSTSSTPSRSRRTTRCGARRTSC